MAATRPAADLGQKLLGDDGFDAGGELDADLLLLMGRKDVDDTVNRRRCGAGVQRCEYQVSGFSESDGGGDCFQIAHFADEDHIRIFPQRRPQGIGERIRVRAKLALIDHAFFVRVQVLNRVFNRQNMRFALRVDNVNQRRDGG